jgi:tRNA A37 threonylcarbamoyladenosine synthetase subunit TsaC/SUA5/YrdC
LRSDGFGAMAIPDASQVDRDAQRVFDVVRGGGVALIPLDVAYALVASAPEAVRRVYAAKGRDFSKPMGIVGGWAAHEALHVLGESRRAMVRAITVERDLPLSVVAPYRADHPYLRKLDEFVLRQSTLDGTLNLLLNAGPLRTRLAALCWEHQAPMAGTSANVSMTGSCFSMRDMDAGIKEICDLVVDYGECRYRNATGLSSTIIDFGTLRVVRRGVCYEHIRHILCGRFDTLLQESCTATR